MAPFIAIGLFAALAGCGVALLCNYRIDVSADALLPRIILALLCVGAFFMGPIIDGLEYEDAYVHKAAATWRALHWSDSVNGFYTPVCMAGSAVDCVDIASFGTQMIGFSTLIALVGLIVGNLPWLANALSAIAGAMTIQITWSLLKGYSPDTVGRFVGIALLLTATAFFLISGSAFAEALFATFFLLYLLCYLRISDASPYPATPALLVTFFVTGALMVLVKKEGIVLVGVLLVFAIVEGIFRRSRNERMPRGFTPILLVAFALIAYSALTLSIFDAASRHGGDIGESPFRLGNVVRLLPVIASAAISPDCYGLIGPLFILSVPVAIYWRDWLSIKLICIVGAYTFIYSIHARHNAFVHGADVHPAEMVRYLYFLVPICAVVVARNLIPQLSTWLREPRPIVVWTALGLLASIGGVFTALNLREARIAMASDEVAARTHLIKGVTPQEILQSVYVTPYSMALIAAHGEEITIVDSTSLRIPLVVDWLRVRQSTGATIVVDREVCASDPEYIRLKEITVECR